MYEIPKTYINSVAIPTLAQFNSWISNPDPDKWLVKEIDGGGFWWLNNTGGSSRYMYIVEGVKANQYDGAVNIQGIKVRPILNLKYSILNQPPGVKVGDHVLFAGQEWIVLTGTQVVCFGSIGSCAFHNDWKDVNAQTYNSASIKDYITNWLDYWTA
jgi:hypothetical protein